MLACSHDKEPFGAPICKHTRTCREAGLCYVRWYTGAGMDSELLCISCVRERESGHLITTELVCKECFLHATNEFGDLEGVRGKPEIRTRAEPFDLQLLKTDLPTGVGKIVDISPVLGEGRAHWLLLAEDGLITRFDADTGEWDRLERANLCPEPDHKPFCGRIVKPRLHASPGGDFASIVNDYGHYGQVIDLRSGRVTLSLDGGVYHSNTVPFSFTFAQIKGRVVAIHRTAWNRLDMSDPSTGNLLTDRNPTSYRSEEDRPLHYLDYFHGAIYLSPNSVRILDDGWVWHPFGIPTTWDLEPWISENVWESEDGPTRKNLCARAYYWDHAMTWLDDNRIAIGGLGDDDEDMIDGVRIFDVSLTEDGRVRWRCDWFWPRELTAFSGPAGSFFSDGQSLFSSDLSGLSRWDVNDGFRTGYLQGFQPTHHHRGARELVQVVDDALVRWAMDDGDAR
jgi:hypothetical protein